MTIFGIDLLLGSPGTNLAGSSNLAGSLPHELVINLGKVESNMEFWARALLYVLSVDVYLLLTNFEKKQRPHSSDPQSLPGFS